MLKPGMAVAYNDVPAVAYLIAPDLFEQPEYYVRISTHDELTKGQTVVDVGNRWGQPPNTRVLMNVKGQELTDMFTERVTSYRSS